MILFNSKCIAICLITLVVFYSCTHETENKSELSNQLIGEWHNTSLKITMNTYKNSDSAVVLEVNEQNWEEKMNIKPIKTFFRADNSYNSEHYSLKDSLIYNPSGKWAIEGDTLHMWDTFPNKGLRYKYKLNITHNKAEFRGIEDCDSDGKADDNYFGTQKRQN